MWVFLDRSAVEVHDERARVVRLEPDQLAGPVVELAEQNAIELVRAPLVSSHTCKRRLGGFVRRGKERRSDFELVNFPIGEWVPCMVSGAQWFM